MIFSLTEVLLARRDMFLFFKRWIQMECVPRLYVRVSVNTLLNAKRISERSGPFFEYTIRGDILFCMSPQLY